MLQIYIYSEILLLVCDNICLTKRESFQLKKIFTVLITMVILLSRTIIFNLYCGNSYIHVHVHLKANVDFTEYLQGLVARYFRTHCCFQLVRLVRNS